MRTNPFKLHEAYTVDDAPRFFGRRRETAQLYNALHASNLVLLYGASGTGKTSLVQCGLHDAFYTTDWLPLSIRRHGNLNDAMARDVRRSLGHPSVLPAEVPCDERVAGLQADLQALYLKHYRPVYLIFDQFEELYILGDSEEQDCFHHTVDALLRADLSCKILLIIREEYLAHLSAFEQAVPSLFDNRLRVERMNDARLKSVIQDMTEYEGITFIDRDATIELIIKQLRERSADLTNLQLYLHQLWEADRRRQGVTEPATITFDPELVERLGDLDMVLSRFLEARLKKLEQSLAQRRGEMSQAASVRGLPLEVLFALVTDEGTKRSMELEEIHQALPPNRSITKDEVQFCLDEFEKLRLLRRLADE